MLLPERQQQFYQQIHHDNKFVVTNSLINVIYKCIGLYCCFMQQYFHEFIDVYYYNDIIVDDPVEIIIADVDIEIVDDENIVASQVTTLNSSSFSI